MTVAELITILQTLDPNAKVRMSMNSEYECEVRTDMVYAYEDTVRIDSEGEDSWG